MNLAQTNRTATIRGRTADISHLMLDRVESILEAMRPARNDPRNLVQRRLARAKCNMLALWRLCDQANCRRALCCRAGLHECLRRQAPHLPHDVIAGAEALLAVARKGRSYKSLSPRARRQVDAFAAWREASLGDGTGPV